ncbi:DUF4412 domain-containing protein [Jiulongibacter sp. NS-SX5]|uniref:DUF4412 domain-containing protein n=1 Tax=Jiulongibacter sp. NS-SX5 TaxID=3463854 RepID=UPI004058AF8F
MKSLNKRISLIFAALVITASANAQIFSPERIKNRIKDRAKDRTAQEVDNRVDRGVDKVLDGLFGTVDKGAKAATDAVKEGASSSKESDGTETSNEEMSQEDAMGMLSGLLGGMGGGAEPAGSYDFESSYTMKLITKEGNEENEFLVKYHFTDNGEYFGSEILSMGKDAPKGMDGQFMVYDLANSTMFTFMNMNGQKNMMSIGMKNLEDSAEGKINSDISETTYTNTGKTKVIAGYTCEGLLMEQDGEKYLAWISKGRVPVVSAYYKSMSKANSAGKAGLKFDYGSNQQMLNMMKEGRALLGMDYLDEKEGTSMEVIEVKASDDFTFNTSGYSNMMDFNKIMQEAQQQQTEQGED